MPGLSRRRRQPRPRGEGSWHGEPVPLLPGRGGLGEDRRAPWHTRSRASTRCRQMRRVLRPTTATVKAVRREADERAGGVPCRSPGRVRWLRSSARLTGWPEAASTPGKSHPDLPVRAPLGRQMGRRFRSMIRIEAVPRLMVAGAGAARVGTSPTADFSGPWRPGRHASWSRRARRSVTRRDHPAPTRASGAAGSGPLALRRVPAHISLASSPTLGLGSARNALFVSTESYDFV